MLNIEEIKERAAHRQAFYHTLNATLKQDTDDIMFLLAEVERLRDQLAESQRREKAAVRDLEEIATGADVCEYCKNTGEQCKLCGVLMQDDTSPSNFEWRGPRRLGRELSRMVEIKACPPYQEEINELLRMKKQFLGPQGCCIQSENRNQWKAHCLSIAIQAISQNRRTAPENKPLTNFQRITESPEKLAEVIAATVHGCWAGVTITDDPAKWLEWLNQPVNEEGPR